MKYKTIILFLLCMLYQFPCHGSFYKSRATAQILSNSFINDYQKTMIISLIGLTVSLIIWKIIQPHKKQNHQQLHKSLENHSKVCRETHSEITEISELSTVNFYDEQINSLMSLTTNLDKKIMWLKKELKKIKIFVFALNDTVEDLNTTVPINENLNTSDTIKIQFLLEPLKQNFHNQHQEIIKLKEQLQELKKQNYSLIDHYKDQDTKITSLKKEIENLEKQKNITTEEQKNINKLKSILTTYFISKKQFKKKNGEYITTKKQLKPIALFMNETLEQKSSQKASTTSHTA